MRSTVTPRAPGAARRAAGPGLRRLVCVITFTGATLQLVETAAADGPPGPPFVEGASPGGARAAPAAPAYLSGARIAAAGDGALVIDEDSGVLARVDAAGAPVAQLAIAPEAGLLTYDSVAGVAYVADRRGDRIVGVRVGGALDGAPTVAMVRTWRTAAEPYGVALTPDRATLLVSHVAGRVVVAYDAATGRERWRTALSAEPRGIAISPDGRRALVAHLTTGALDEIALDDREVTHRALPVVSGGARARGAFAVMFLGDDLAVAPFQRATPVPDPSEEIHAGHYGGAAESPITQHLALVGLAGRAGRGRTTAARLRVHLPRAIAWDGARDALYVAGLGGDDVVQIAKASQVDVRPGFSGSVGGKEPCGPDGLAIASDGNLLVWCAFARSVARVAVLDGDGQLAARWRATRGPSIAPSALDATRHRGMVLFHRADTQLSRSQLACASCHPEGRADGLSWRLDRDVLQTPILAGRIAGTAPYKWSGGARDLPASLRETIARLGGFGVGRPSIAALAAYLEAMPAVRAPGGDAPAVARGKQVFDEAGCSGCHDGARYTDRQRHRLAPGQRAIDTPSLLGLAASAPYFHDGSAATLDGVLRARGAVHGMSEPALRLDDRAAADLIAFLESL